MGALQAHSSFLLLTAAPPPPPPATREPQSGAGGQVSAAAQLCLQGRRWQDAWLLCSPEPSAALRATPVSAEVLVPSGTPAWALTPREPGPSPRSLVSSALTLA